jgi:hypothetical protein
MPFRQRVARHFGDTTSSLRLQAKFYPRLKKAQAAPQVPVTKKTEPTANRVAKSPSPSSSSSSFARNIPTTTGRDSWDNIRAGRRITRSSKLTIYQLSPTAPYLSYHDILLTGDDMRSLKHDWLTDNNIAFWEEYGHEPLCESPIFSSMLLTCSPDGLKEKSYPSTQRRASSSYVPA